MASSPLLDGVVGFKSSYQAFRNEKDIIRLPNVSYKLDAKPISEFRNLRSQCIFKLASLVNSHDIAVVSEDARIKSYIIEELSTYQDASVGDGKRLATKKEDIKELIGRSPDLSDTLIMRMYFVLREGITSETSEEVAKMHKDLQVQFDRTESRVHMDSSK